MQECQQDTDSFLLIPGQHQGQRQVVDAAVKCVRQSKGSPDRAVCIVALSHVHDPRKSADAARIEIIEPVFPAGESEHCRIGRRLLYKIRIIAAAFSRSVASAYKENVL